MVTDRLQALRVAVESLLEQTGASVTELSIGAICTEAGISRPTFYASFDDKLDLVRALVAETISDLVGASWLNDPDPTRADLEQSMAALFAAYAPHRRVMAAAAEVASYDPELRRRFTAAIEAAATPTAEYIRSGQAAGTIRPELDAIRTARALSWMAEAGLRRAFADRAKASRADIVAMTDLHWFTIFGGRP